jgi:type I restriction enzyme M protein
MAKTSSKPASGSNGSPLGFEATLWATAHKLLGNLDTPEYKHVVLGLIFLKYISDAFGERRAAMLPKLLSGGLRIARGPHRQSGRERSCDG